MPPHAPSPQPPTKPAPPVRGCPCPSHGHPLRHTSHRRLEVRFAAKPVEAAAHGLEHVSCSTDVGRGVGAPLRTAGAWHRGMQRRLRRGSSGNTAGPGAAPGGRQRTGSGRQYATGSRQHPRGSGRYLGGIEREFWTPAPMAAEVGGVRRDVLEKGGGDGFGFGGAILRLTGRLGRGSMKSPTTLHIGRPGGKGGLKGGGGGGVKCDPSSSEGPPMVPTEGGPKILKLNSSWHRRGRSKISAVSLKHWKGRTGGGGV